MGYSCNRFRFRGMILQIMDRDPRAGAFRVYVGPISPYFSEIESNLVLIHCVKIFLASSAFLAPMSSLTRPHVHLVTCFHLEQRVRSVRISLSSAAPMPSQTASAAPQPSKLAKTEPLLTPPFVPNSEGAQTPPPPCSNAEAKPATPLIVKFPTQTHEGLDLTSC